MSKFFTVLSLVLVAGACTPKQMSLVIDTIELPDDKHGNRQVYEHYTSDEALDRLAFRTSGAVGDPSSKISNPGRAGQRIEFEPMIFFTLQQKNPQRWCRKKMKTKINRSQKKRYKELKKRAKGKFKHVYGNF